MKKLKELIMEKISVLTLDIKENLKETSHFIRIEKNKSNQK
jgi:hypothetical protein